jgi:hypothetical protein
MLFRTSLLRVVVRSQDDKRRETEGTPTDRGAGGADLNVTEKGRKGRKKEAFTINARSFFPLSIGFNPRALKTKEGLFNLESHLETYYAFITRYRRRITWSNR